VTEVINPATGELMDRLDQAPTETLAEVYGAVRAQQVRLEDMRRALKGELQNRLEVRGVARMTVGAYEVGESHGWRSKWDGQQLEAVVREPEPTPSRRPQGSSGGLPHPRARTPGVRRGAVAAAHQRNRGGTKR
jgi:hypothetical protein